MHILFTGDLLLTRPLYGALHAGLLDDFSQLSTSCEAVFGNLETTLHDGKGWARAESGGSWLHARPEVAEDLRLLGFSMLARANNHALDYDVAALHLTSATLDAAGICHAGAGENLDEAREARFLETSTGRVALISCCSTLPSGAEATSPSRGLRGRPGISPLRFQKQYRLPPSAFQVLREIAQRSYFDKLQRETSVMLAPHSFTIGDEYAVESQADEEDLSALQTAVVDARQLADLVIVSIHSHEAEGNWEWPAQFLREAAHKLVEAGADMIVGHGPHLLRGVELYQGVPILYSLGSFLFQNDLTLRYPDDQRRQLKLPVGVSRSEVNQRRFDFTKDTRFWETVAVRGIWQGQQLQELRFYPFVIDQSSSWLSRGLPKRADHQAGQAILQRFAHLSRSFDTTIRNQQDFGILELNVSK